ncbi:MAG: HlyD family efflux transporter periplasmic adaptor subunit [Bacteroidetes bacterium]|nr:HlyD family efflux transporter periplasmic adaptor subunit [Bacteroidota bacterium]
MPEEKEIILRTEEVNEILTSTPKWILRWGITVVFLLIIIAVVLSYFIKYPDVLTADITLTTLNPPVTIIAKNSGKLTHLLVKDKAFVKTNQIIGVIENTAEYKDVLYLLNQTNVMFEQVKYSDTLNYIRLTDSLKTGEITPFYLQLIKATKDLNIYLTGNPYLKQITLLKKDLAGYSALVPKYQKQEQISNEQLKLALSDFNRDKKLFEEKVITAREYENQKKNYLNAQNSNEQSKITVSSAIIQINSIEKNILQLQIQDYQETAKLKNELLQQLKTLKNEILKWKQLFLIESPVSGKISYFNFWVTNQNVKQGDELFAIIPEKKQEFIGKCVLAITNSGKLAIGQKANIKLDNYPFNENGILNGIVTNISEVPTKEGYLVDISLPNGLKTSYQKTIIYKELMKGKAEIITKNISVMDRIFFNFRKLMKR